MNNVVLVIDIPKINIKIFEKKFPIKRSYSQNLEPGSDILP